MMAAHQPAPMSGLSTASGSDGRADSKVRLSAAEAHPAGSNSSDSAHAITAVPTAAAVNALSGSFSLQEGLALPSLTSLSGSFGGAFWTVGASVASSGRSQEAEHTDCNSARQLAKPTLLGASFTGGLDHLGSPALQAVAAPATAHHSGSCELGLSCAMPISSSVMPRRVAGAAALLSFSSLGSSFSGTVNHAAFPLASCIEALAAMSVDGSGSAFSSSGLERAPSVPRPAGLWTALAESPMISGTSGFSMNSDTHGSRIPRASSLFAASLAMPSPVGITSNTPKRSAVSEPTHWVPPQPCVVPGVRHRHSTASNAESPCAGRMVKRGREHIAVAAVSLAPGVRNDHIVTEVLPHAPELTRHDMVRRPVRPIPHVEGALLDATRIASMDLAELTGAAPLGKPLVRGNGQIIAVTECQARTPGACAEVLCISLVTVPQMGHARSFDVVFHASVPLLSPHDAPGATLGHVCWVDLDCSAFAVAIGRHVGLLHVNEVWPGGDGPRPPYASAQWLPRRRQPSTADGRLVSKQLAMHDDDVRCLHVITRPSGDEYLLLSGGWDGVVWCSNLKWRHGRGVGFVDMDSSGEPRQVLCGSSPVSCIANGASGTIIVTTDDGRVHICGVDALCNSVHLLRSIDTGKPGLFACAPSLQSAHGVAGMFGFGDGSLYSITDGRFHCAVNDPTVSEIGAIELFPVTASLTAIICSGVGGVSLWLSSGTASTPLTCVGSMPLMCQPATPAGQTMRLDWHAVHGVDISVPATLFTYVMQPKTEASISHVTVSGKHTMVLVVTDSLSGVAVYDLAAILQRAGAAREATVPLSLQPAFALSTPLNMIQRACQFFYEYPVKTRARFSTRNAASAVSGAADEVAIKKPARGQRRKPAPAGDCLRLSVRSTSQRAAAARAIQSLFADAAAALSSGTESDYAH